MDYNRFLNLTITQKNQKVFLKIALEFFFNFFIEFFPLESLKKFKHTFKIISSEISIAIFKDLKKCS